MPLPESFLYLREEDVQQTLNINQAIELARKGIHADAKGKVVGNKFYTPISNFGFIKPFTGYLEGEEYFFAKTFNFFQDNPDKYNLPATSSLVILFEAETGYPACLMESAWVTGLKTAASTAVTAEYLARNKPKTGVVFGAGSLGSMHLRALDSVFNLEEVYVIDRYPEISQACASEVSKDVKFSLIPAFLEDREDIVKQSDIIITVTTGAQPLVERAWVQKGAFIARLGSYQELTHDVITGADKVIVDNWH
jgi:alanine dehydrogenase